MANVVEATQCCTRCGETKPLLPVFFRPHNEKRKDGTLYTKLKRICRTCELTAAKKYNKRPEVREAQKEWQKKEYHRTKDKHRAYRINRIYGLTEEDYTYLLVKQNGCCAICKTNVSTRDKTGNPQRFSIDHNHTTGKVRGLLCGRCNTALGLFLDDTKSLEQAIIYLKEN